MNRRKEARYQRAVERTERDVTRRVRIEKRVLTEMGLNAPPQDPHQLGNFERRVYHKLGIRRINE